MNTHPRMTHRTVSLLICTRNRPLQLLRCLESLLVLDYDLHEIIVIDNGSDSFTIPKLNYPCSTRFYRQPVPGASYARNTAIRYAKGEILAWIDDDAVAHPDWLKQAIPNFDHPGIACVTGRILPLELKTEWQRKMWQSGGFPIGETAKMYDNNNLSPLSPWPGVNCNLLIRGEVAKRHPYAEWLGPGSPAEAGEENYLFYKILRQGWSIFYDPKAVVYHDFPEKEIEYKTKVIQNSKSRGAYLTRFLLFEKGYRRLTLIHLIKKALGIGSTQEEGVPPKLKAKGLILGALALFPSMRMAKKNSKTASSSGTLLAEFQAGQHG